MSSKKEIKAKAFSFNSEDKNKIINEKIIFIDIAPKNNLILLLSSHNTFYICEIINNLLTIKKKFGNVIDSAIKISKSYFCNENPNNILLLSDNSNIYEWTIDREYISHIYYDVLGETYEFKMNCQKNATCENVIQNFCIFQENKINVWNSMKYNKKNVMHVENVNCFSYDSTGLLLYYIEKLIQKYYIRVIKFVDEYECKEIYYKTLLFQYSKINIDYINCFDVNIIISDTKLGKVFIYKNYPIKEKDFEISLNNTYSLYMPFIGLDPLFQFGILCFNINNNSQSLINVCYKSKTKNIENVELRISDLYYLKENIKGKGLLLGFNDLTKELIQYDI
jgi:hypothetical protein